MGAHAPFAPSSLSRLMACAGSFELVRHYPDDEDSPAAKEGTAAHWVAERLLTDGELVPAGTLAPNGVEVTQEMVEGAELYCRHIRNTVGDPSINIDVEVRIDTGLHDDCWGTPDAIGNNGEHHVFDYKFGHRFVNEFENWQLIAYAWGTVRSAKLRENSRVHLHIVQPRSYDRRGPVRTWSLTVAELELYAIRIRHRLVGIASGELRDCVTGDHCYMCPARRGCSALQQAGYLACDIVGQNEPLDLAPDALGLELSYLKQAAKLLEQRIAGLEEQAEATIAAGQRVPGWGVISKPGRERWRAGVTVAEIAAVGALWGQDLTRTEPITPAQARKKLSDASLLEPLTERPSSLSLQPDNMQQVRRIFSA